MKRILAMLLSVLMLAGMLPLGVLADEPAEQPEVIETEEPLSEQPEQQPEEQLSAQQTEEPSVEELPAEEPVLEEEPEYIWSGLSDEAFLEFVLASKNAKYLSKLLNNKKGEEYIAFAARVKALSADARAEVSAYLEALTVSEEQPSEEQPSEEPSEEQPSEEPSEEQPSEEPSEEQPSEEPSEEQPSEEQPEEQPSEEQPDEQPSEEQPSEEQPEEQPTEEQPEEQQPEEQPEEQPSEEQPSEEQPEEQPTEEQPEEQQPEEQPEEQPTEEQPEEQQPEEQPEEQPSEELPAEEELTGEEMFGLELLDAAANQLKADIEAAGSAVTTIPVTGDVVLQDELKIPENITLEIKSGVLFLVSASGGKIVNNGLLKVRDGGRLEVNGTYSGTRIWAESANAKITPTTLPHGVASIAVFSISDFTVGDKIKVSDSPETYKYKAGSGVPAKVGFGYSPSDAWWDIASLTYSSDLDGALTPNEKGRITLTTVGEHTITIKAPSPSTAQATCKVTVEAYALEIYDSNDSEHQKYLTAGESLTITAEMKPANLYDTTFMPPEISSADEQYASLGAADYSDNKMVFTLNARDITEQHTVSVRIRTKDGKLDDTYDVDIYPAPVSVRAIWDDGSDTDVTDETLYYDISDLSFPGFVIKAQITPLDADQKITWSYEDTNKTAKVDISSNGTDTAKVKVTASGNNTEGYVTLTGKAYSGATVTVPIYMTDLDTSIKIDVPDDPGYLKVRAGDKITLTATTGTAMTGDIKWSVDPAYASWGSIDEKTGVFTATNYASSQGDIEEVDVTATLVINKKEVASDTIGLKVVPTASSAVIKMGSETFLPTDTIKLNGVKGNSWKLTGVITPGSFTDADITDLTGEWSCSDPNILTLTPDKNDKNKCTVSVVETLEGIATGTCTITFTADDGSGVKTSVKATVSSWISDIQLYSDEAHTTQQNELTGGTGLQIYAVVKPSTATNLKLDYEVINCDSSFKEDSSDTGVYATVSTTGKVTAKTVYSDHYVIVRVSATDGSQTSADYKLKIVPKSSGSLLILNKDDGDRDITGTTVQFDLNKVTKLNFGVMGYEQATFKSSNASVLKVDPNTGVCTYAGGTLKKPLTVTVTATDNLNPLRKSTVKVTVTKLVQSGTLTVDSSAAALAAGQSMTMTAKVTSAALNKTVTWSLGAGDTAYATITAKGVLKANATLTKKADITVIATAKDGSGVKGTKTITVYPKVSYILLDDGTDVVSGRTINVDINDGPIQLNADVQGPDAMPDVTWKSSSTKIATVDQTGKVTINNTGKVTITATAKDGSKKSAKVTYKVIAMVDQYELDLSGKNTEGGKLVVNGGAKVQLKVKFIDPKKPTNSKVKWEIEKASDRAYATVTTGGKLTAAKVTGMHTITVRCIPLDDPDENSAQDFSVIIRPSVASIALKSGSINVTGTTQEVALSAGSVTLSADVFPSDASQNVTWKSSSTKIATVDSTGKVTFLKAGKVTITVTAQDGSRKSARVTLKITNN